MSQVTSQVMSQYVNMSSITHIYSYLIYRVCLKFIKFDDH